MRNNPSTTVLGSRTRETLAQLLDRRRLLLLANLLIFLLVCRGLEALPW